MSGSTADPSHNIIFIRSAVGDETNALQVAGPGGAVWPGQTFTVADYAYYTIDKIWVRGNDFVAGRTFMVDLYDVPTASGPYTWPATNSPALVAEGEFVFPLSTGAPQWVSFDMPDVALDANGAYAFRLAAQSQIIDWRLAAADPAIAAIEGMLGSYQEYDFAFAIEATVPEPTVMIVASVGGLALLRRRKK